MSEQMTVAEALACFDQQAQYAHTIRWNTDPRYPARAMQEQRERAHTTLAALAQRVEELERYRVAFDEYHAKTQWVQESAQIGELGRHRADVLRMRIEAAESRAAELERECGRLRAHLAAMRDDMHDVHPLDFSPGAAADAIDALLATDHDAAGREGEG